jgi:hypothetical protein
MEAISEHLGLMEASLLTVINFLWKMRPYQAEVPLVIKM